MYGGEVKVYERDKLYEQVWGEPMRAVAKSYGVSDSYLARICRELGVPLPGRGYWAKVRAGKAPRKLKLPRLKKGQKDRVVSLHRTPTPRRQLDLPPDAALAVTAPIVVSDELTEPHRLVATAARRLAKAKPSQGVVAGRPLGLIDLTVSPASLDRALRIYDALLKALAQAGLKFEVTGPAETVRDSWGREIKRGPDRLTRVCCQEEWIAFALWEKVSRTEDPKPEVKPQRSVWGTTYTPWQPTTYTYTPTGQLVLQMTEASGLGLRTSFGDGKRQRLEDCLGSFVSQLGVVAAAIKADRAEKGRKAKEAAAAHERRERELERQRREQERLKHLVAEAEDWHRAEKLRAYAWEAMNRLKLSHPSAEDYTRRRQDLKRLLDHADDIDPLIRGSGD